MQVKICNELHCLQVEEELFVHTMERLKENQANEGWRRGSKKKLGRCWWKWGWAWSLGSFASRAWTVCWQEPSFCQSPTINFPHFVNPMVKDWEYRWAFIFLSFSGRNFVIKFISTPHQCQALLQEFSSQEKGLELLRPKDTWFGTCFIIKSNCCRWNHHFSSWLSVGNGKDWEQLLSLSCRDDTWFYLVF